MALTDYEPKKPFPLPRDLDEQLPPRPPFSVGPVDDGIVAVVARARSAIENDRRDVASQRAPVDQGRLAKSLATEPRREIAELIRGLLFIAAVEMAHELHKIVAEIQAAQDGKPLEPHQYADVLQKWAAGVFDPPTTGK